MIDLLSIKKISNFLAFQVQMLCLNSQMFFLLVFSFTILSQQQQYEQK